MSQTKNEKRMAAAQKIVDQFNARFQVGTLFHYFPIRCEATFEPRRTRSPAWVLQSGEPVVQLAGRSGCFSLHHLRFVSLQSEGVEKP